MILILKINPKTYLIKYTQQLLNFSFTRNTKNSSFVDFVLLLALVYNARFSVIAVTDKRGHLTLYRLRVDLCDVGSHFWRYCQRIMLHRGPNNLFWWFRAKCFDTSAESHLDTLWCRKVYFPQWPLLLT